MILLAVAPRTTSPNFNPNPAILPRRSLPLRRHRLFSPKSQTTNSADGGFSIPNLKILANFKSNHNYIRVLQIPRFSPHRLAGARLLLLDAPGNIHSISYPFNSLTNAYFDVFATLPPILPAGPIAILGFGAGSVARLLLELYPHITVHGYELDPSVLAVAREYFGLDKLEKRYSNRLFIHTGNALDANIPGGFAGLLIDLFSKGCVIPELLDCLTWENLKKVLQEGGRIMVNAGGRCVEAEDAQQDGRLKMEQTLKAMAEVFPGEVSVLKGDGREYDNVIALTGSLPDANEWKKALRRPLKFYIDSLEPYETINQLMR